MYSSASSVRGFSSAAESKPYEPFATTTIEVPMRIRSFDREERMSFVQLTISMTSVPGSHHQMLQVQITDEQDPFFLYVLECGEAEFHALRQEQAILVDFMVFPHKLIELLEMCYKRDETPRFICVLDRNRSMEASLNIVETNQFKQLTHLSLKFKGGTDEVLKTHLASRVKDFKAYCEELEHKLRVTNDNLMTCKAELTGVTRDYEALQSDLERRLEERRLNEQEKFTQYKEHSLQTEQQLKSQFENERSELVHRYERQTQETREKLETTLRQVDELKAANYKLESQEREMSIKQRQMEHELEMVNSELTHLRSSSKSLETGKFEQERAITEAKLTLQNLQRELRDKDELNAKLSALLDSNSDYKGQQEDTIQMLKATVEKLEDKLHQSATEINKGNSIIQKLQNEIKNGKQKLKLKDSVLLQQENMIQQKQEAADKLDREIHNLQRELEKRDDSSKESNGLVSELRAKLEEAHRTLETNKSTIQWLNERLNKAEQAKVPYTTTYKPTTAASPALAFKPSNYTIQQYMAGSPSSAKTGQVSDVAFTRLFEPVKYKEPQ